MQLNEILGRKRKLKTKERNKLDDLLQPNSDANLPVVQNTNLPAIQQEPETPESVTSKLNRRGFLQRMVAQLATRGIRINPTAQVASMVLKTISDQPLVPVAEPYRALIDGQGHALISALVGGKLRVFKIDFATHKFTDEDGKRVSRDAISELSKYKGHLKLLHAIIDIHIGGRKPASNAQIKIQEPVRTPEEIGFGEPIKRIFSENGLIANLHKSNVVHITNGEKEVYMSLISGKMYDKNEDVLSKQGNEFTAIKKHPDYLKLLHALIDFQHG